MLWTILASLDAPDNGRAAVADDPGASRVLVQQDVVKHVVNSGSLEAVCGDVVHHVVDAVQVLVGGTAGDGLERTGEECGEQVLALRPEEGDDPVYAVAGFGVDAQDMPLEGAVLRNSSCRRVSELIRDTEIDFAFFGCVFLSFFCGKVISHVRECEARYTWAQDRRVDTNVEGSDRCGGVDGSLAIDSRPEHAVGIFNDIFRGRGCWAFCGARIAPVHLHLTAQHVDSMLNEAFWACTGSVRVADTHGTNREVTLSHRGCPNFGVIQNFWPWSSCVCANID